MFKNISPDLVLSGRTSPANLGVRSFPVRKNDKRTLSMCRKIVVAKFVESLLVHIFRDLMNTKVFCCLWFWNLKKCLFCEKANGILLPKLFRPTVRRNCSSDGEKICKNFEITRTICSNSERSEQFLVTECFFNLFLEVSQI